MVRLVEEPLRSTFTNAIRWGLELWHSLPNSANKDAAFVHAAKDSHHVTALTSSGIELPGWVGFDEMGGKIDHVGWICVAIRAVLRKSGDIESNIEVVLSELDHLLSSSRVDIVVTAPLESTATLPDDTIALSNGVDICPFAQDDVFPLVLSSYRSLPTHQLRFKVANGLRFSPGIEPSINATSGTNAGTPFPRSIFDKIQRLEAVACALHLCSSGRHQVLQVVVRPDSPLPLPYALRIPRVQPADYLEPPVLAIEKSDLVVTVNRALTAKNGSIHYALVRLKESSNRNTWSDALVDACIGLESLLNSGKTDVTVRMAMNYASLFPQDERACRYHELKALYELRSTIVHGGPPENIQKALNKFDKRIHTNAGPDNFARDLLRTTLHRFLADDQLRDATSKLDEPFWERRWFAQIAHP